MNDLCQFFTPTWVAEALIERHFPRLDMSDTVIEPSCGGGSFLQAIPAAVPAIGVEIDPQVAAAARAATGREIITGDFRDVPIGLQPTAIIGNPPFRASVFDGFLERAHALLPDGARAGFILPTYFFQTAGRVCRYAERWSIAYDMMPRNAFHSRMRTPMVFAVFSKDMRRTMVGFALYAEADALTKMAAPYRELLSGQQGSAWRAVCALALRRLGGEASLSQIYGELERNRPTQTSWWREKIRQTLRVYADFRAIGAGRYALAAA
jgi:site-specific DNA-methyltransferase (adenine-specific)